MSHPAGPKRQLTYRDIALAAVGGFFLSFAVFFFAVLFPSSILFRAQLLVQGPVGEYPMSYHVLVNDQFQKATTALASFWFWTAVLVTGFFTSFWLLRSFR